MLQTCLSVPNQFFWKFWWSSSTGRSFCPSASDCPCQYHSTTAPYSFIYLQPSLYNIFFYCATAQLGHCPLQSSTSRHLCPLTTFSNSCILTPLSIPVHSIYPSSSGSSDWSSPFCVSSHSFHKYPFFLHPRHQAGTSVELLVLLSVLSSCYQ